MYTCSFSFFFSELKSPRMHVLLFLHQLDPQKKKEYLDTTLTFWIMSEQHWRV
jgi:hypothetical protein